MITGRYDISPWAKKAGAVCLVEGYEKDLAEQSLPSEVISSLDAMLSFDGHNGFIGAGGKEDAVRRLQTIARRSDRPTPQAVEDYLLSTGKTGANGARRAGQWYEEMIAGKRHRDYRGQFIV